MTAPSSEVGPGGGGGLAALWSRRPHRTSTRTLPTVPPGLRIYVIGDVHGRADCLTEVFTRIDTDKDRFPIDDILELYIGDYVDRGFESRTVIDLLRARACRHPTVHLLGNHEVMLLDAVGKASMAATSMAEMWRRSGGPETLASYGLPASGLPGREEWADMLVRFREIWPKTHQNFLNRCQTTFSCGSYFFVHAGIRPGVAIDRQVEGDLVWIREPFLSSMRDHGVIVVHGHTPSSDPELHLNRINIDTGAYITGNLTCLSLEGSAIHLI